MFWVLLIFSVLLGLACGSFLNVVVLRYGTGRSALSGRSACPVCGTKLETEELIPVFSYLFQGGRCRHCNAHISLQYPIGELLTACVFVLVFVRQWIAFPLYISISNHPYFFFVAFLVFYFVISFLLLAIALYDIRHKIIPQGLVYAFIILSLLKLIFYFYCAHIVPTTFPYTFDLLAPVFVALPISLLWLVSHGRWIGFGDAKLSFGMGALLGFVSGLSALALGFWIGAASAIVLLIAGRLKGSSALTMQSEIPFAPFLILATFIVLLWRVDVLGLASFFVR